MKSLLYILFLCAAIPVAGQKQNNNWYFGDSAGVTFNTNPPTALTDGMLSTEEGCASISTASGLLLFYTDGVTIWNKQHIVMANGTGLKGHESSTQSAIIVPWPGNTNKYLVFTVGAEGMEGFYYSVVDMTLQGAWVR